ncbi:MAG: LuxR C-terminal-related transcriptional regulator [Phycisphaerales bacterium]
MTESHLLPTPPQISNTDLAWAALISDPAIGVAIVDAGGVFHFANARFTRLFGIDDPRAVIGSAHNQHFPPDCIDEWASIAARVLTTRRPIVVRRVYRGRQLQCTLWPAPGADGGCHHVLIVSHQGEHDPVSADLEVVESGLVDLGPLDVLSKRELEVLALLGQAHSLDEIARLLHRSRKTIDNHRQSICRKLGESSRVRLAQLAREAALRTSDASLQRIRRGGTPN